MFRLIVNGYYEGILDLNLKKGILEFYCFFGLSVVLLIFDSENCIVVVVNGYLGDYF